MVKTALNSKRKLIYSIKWYAFIIVQVVKFMHKRVTCKWFWAIYLSFHFVFWQIFKCNIRQRLIYCNHFSVAKFFFGTIFRLNYFVYFIWPKDKAFWWKGVVSMTVFFLSLSLSLYQVQSMRDNTDLVTIVLLFKFCIFIIIII